MFRADPPRPQASRRCFWRRLLYLCLIWQLAVLVVAVTSCTLGLRDSGVVQAADERHLLGSLIEPTAAERMQSTKFVSKLRRDYDQAADRWRAACVDALGWPRIAGASGFIPDWYDRPRVHAYTPEFNSRDPAYLACAAVQNGLADEKLLDLLDASPRRPVRPDWARQTASAKFMLYVMMQRYEDAEKLLGAWGEVYGAKFAPLMQSLRVLRQDPHDASETYRLLRATRDYLERQAFTPALIGQTWKLYDQVGTDALRAESLGLLAELYGTWDKAQDLEVAEKLYVAAARTHNESSAAKEACARVVADRAYHLLNKGEAQEAVALFYAVAQRYPGTLGWGIAAFNAGTLLRQHGHPCQARAVLSQIFESTANDRDPTPFIMSAYRNYRHRAAIEISRSYRDQFNFPAAHWWHVLASLKYPYQSWCGTCRWQRQSRMARERLWEAFLAGPAFLAPTVALNPVHYWYLWISAAGIALGYRIVVRRRLRCLDQPAPSPQHERA